MSATINQRSGISKTICCYVVLLSSCNGFQAPTPTSIHNSKLQRAATSKFSTLRLGATTSGSDNDSFLDILKDYDEDFERDPTLYYQVDNDSLFDNILNRSTGGRTTHDVVATANAYNDDVDDDDDDTGLVNIKLNEVAADNFLKANYDSFKNVEGITNQILQDNPLLAVGIFIGAGLFVAYLTGFLILDGTIESWNPANNGNVPYWEEGDIHVIQRIRPN